MNNYGIAIEVGNNIRYHNFKDKSSISIGADAEDDIYLPGLLDHKINMESMDPSFPIMIRYSDDNGANATTLEHGKLSEIKVNGIQFRIFASHQMDPQRFSFDNRNIVYFGPNGDVCLKDNFASIEIEYDGAYLVPILDTYVNGTLISERTLLRRGDAIFMRGYNFVFDVHCLLMTQSHQPEINLKPIGLHKTIYDNAYPDFRRSPRLIYPEPTDDLSIENPPSSPSKPTDKIGKLIATPLVSLSTTVVMSLIRANMMFILMGVVTTTVTLITSIVNFVQKSKQYKVDIVDREDYYVQYLKRKAIEIDACVSEQSHSLEYHYPEINKVYEFVENLDSRIYERNRHHFDFLKFRLGSGDVDLSFKIKFEQHEVEMNKDPLIVEASHMKQRFDVINNGPISTDLAHGMLGLIGKRTAVVKQIQMMLLQTAFFHSYHDLEFVSVFSEDEKPLWDPLIWLPHFTLRSFNMRGFVYHERSKDQIMSSLNQVLKDRKQAIEDKQAEAKSFTPHYILVVADEKLIIDHPIMEILSEDPIDLGVTLIQVKDVIEDLNEHTKTIIDIRNDREGLLVTENGELVNKRFNLEINDFPIESFVRQLAPLNHLLSMSSSIPERVSFLEMYGVEDVNDLGIAQRWSANETYKSLAVPLGLRGEGDIVYLNLHEKAHGPHGLVAGTTGSGKSEIVQSYILSLAINFHPYEVAFLLIDYKGGGMANLFKNLPHHLGSITNLDGAQSMRALISIKAELQRRQRLFSQYEVNHINQYQKLFKEDNSMTPMPHLFLISDEFAELKSEQPEFMKELVSTARIGRSLGIHLILATQKPSGVVDDQIWSNSRFKLCLKVADAADSKEMLKTPDAANITLPGRSYLQVGNNEIYELFQSAYSGSDYHEDKTEVIKDTRIYKINDLGQLEVLTQDLSGLTNQKVIKKSVSELDAVIETIGKVAIQERVEKLDQPWLPPLEPKISASAHTTMTFQEQWNQNNLPFEVVTAIKDEPHLQAQNLHKINLQRDGHFTVYGSPGMGKSTTLQTIVMGSARVFSPEKLHVYLMDFGTNGLLPLRKLPHIGDVFTIDDKEKISKWVNLMKKEVKERKKLLSEVGVANLQLYEQSTGKKMPFITVVIDNYDAIRESDFQDILDPFIIQISRDGAALGMHLLMSASRGSSMRFQLSSNIKLQTVLYMIDPSEVNSIVGRSQFTIDEVQGRAMMKLDGPTLMQIIQPADGDDSLDIIDNIRKESEAMDAYYTGERPKKIPMMPELLTQEYFEGLESVKAIKKTGAMLTFALDYYNVEAYPVKYMENFYYVGQNQIQVNSRVDMFVDFMLENDHQPTVLDLDSKPLVINQSKYKNYLSGTEATEKCIRDIHELMKRREQTVNEFYQNSDIDGAQAYIANERPVFIVMNNIFKISEAFPKTVQGMLIELLNTLGRFKISILVFTDIASTSMYGDIQKYIKQVPEVLLEMKIADQSFYSINKRIQNEQQLSINDAYFIKDGEQVKVKIVENR